MHDDPENRVELAAAEKCLLVERKATCPFIAAVIVEGTLGVRNDFNDPLASIEDVRALGNAGGGNLGNVLARFASGNHAFMRGESDQLDRPVPHGLFSLEFPGSQGSHPGHSGILQGNPHVPGSGRFSATDFARLTCRAQQAHVARSDVARFIAENLYRDPEAEVFWTTSAALLGNALRLAATCTSALTSKFLADEDRSRTARRNVEQKLTKLLGRDNLFGSCGEFGLLFALLQHRPGGTKTVGREPAISVHDLEGMFLDKRLPPGWQDWKKTRRDWLRHTSALATGAFREYRVLKRKGGG